MFFINSIICGSQIYIPALSTLPFSPVPVSARNTDLLCGKRGQSSLKVRWHGEQCGHAVGITCDDLGDLR